MSTHAIPPQPGPPGGPMPEPKKPRRWLTHTLWAIATVAAFVIGSVAGAGVDTTTDGDPGTDTVASDPTTSAAEPAVEEPEPEPTPEYDTPTPDDFELAVKTLEKECFGSAGCHVVFRVELGYADANLSFDPSVTYEVTYEIRGVEDGPQINTMTVVGEEYETDREESASTSSSDVELTAVVTDVTPL